MGTLNFGARAPHMQQFDLKGKETRDLTPEELEANLRSHGCPANMVARVVERHAKRYGYSRKESVVNGRIDDVPKVKLEERVAQLVTLLRKTERAVGKALSHSEASALLRAQTSATKDGSGIYSYDSLREHMQTCSDLAECSYAIAGTVNDLLDSWPGTNDGEFEEEDDSLRSRGRTKGDRKRHKEMHDLHKKSHRMLGEACENIARMRLTAGQIVD